MKPKPCCKAVQLHQEIGSLQREISELRKTRDKLRSMKFNNGNKPHSKHTANRLKGSKDAKSTGHNRTMSSSEKEKTDEIIVNLNCMNTQQAIYIEQLEQRLQQMKTHYETQVLKIKDTANELEAQLKTVKLDLCRLQVKSKKSNDLKMNIDKLRQEVLHRDQIITNFDSQFKNIMSLIDELRHRKLKRRKDKETQTVAETDNDLIFYTSATLEHIIDKVATTEL